MDYKREILEDELKFIRERRQLRRQEHQKSATEGRRRYFIKQRLYGLALITITVLAVIVLGGDAVITVIMLPLAGYLLFSKEMLIVDHYYWETKEREYK